MDSFATLDDFTATRKRLQLSEIDRANALATVSDMLRGRGRLPSGKDLDNMVVERSQLSENG